MTEGFSFHAVQTVLLGLLVCVAAISGFARRLNISYPIVLILAGLLASFIPGLPRIPLPPDVVFLVFLPPLLFASAWNTSWREFKRNIVSISMLAIGLVAFTAWAIAETADRFITDLDWKSGFLLGAVVSPTDAIAASSIARRLGLPRTVVDILEGESLVNDATGLLALEFGIEMLVRGQTPTISQGLLRLAWLLGGGVAIGLIVGVVVAWFEKWVDDGPVEIVITLIVPYGVYLAGESIKASGVIAVVTCGLYLGRQSARFFSPETRLQASAVWDALNFLLNGLVFVLIGLQLPYVLAGISHYSRPTLIAYGAVFSAILIVVRLVWMFPASRVAYFINRRVLHRDVELASKKSIFVVGWTGMRGVVALAAAGSLPYTLENGQPFGQRNLIIFLTFCVILVTLVLQGLTLPPLIRALGLAGSAGPECEEGDARRIMLTAAIAHLEEGRANDGAAFEHAYEDLLHQYQHKLDEVNDCGDSSSSLEDPRHHLRHILRGTVQVERVELIRLRDEGRISDEVLRTLERELDLSESKLGMRPNS